MLRDFRQIYRLLRQQPEARIFMINLWTHAKLGAISLGEVNRFLQIVKGRQSRAEAAAQSFALAPGSLVSKSILADCLWLEAENSAIDQVNGFLLTPLRDCPIHSLKINTQVFTVLDAKSFATRYLSPGAFLRHCGVTMPHGTDRKVAEKMLETHVGTGVVKPGLMPSPWLKSVFNAMAKSQRFAPTYRTKIPAFWVRPSGIFNSGDATRLRNSLGLVHYKHDTLLIEIGLSTKPFRVNIGKLRPVHKLMRPNTLGCRPGPRFRAAKPSEIIRFAASKGITSIDSDGCTVDLEMLAQALPEVSGLSELVAGESPWISYYQPPGVSEVDRKTFADQWWQDFEPEIRVLGRVDVAPAIKVCDDDDLGYARRLRADLTAALQHRIPRFGL